MHVSVLMAAYNEVSTIEKSVKSIQAQTHKDWEMIVVDDHSTDGTFEQLKRIEEQDPRVTVLRNKKNLGLAASLNLAWKRSRGELLARMDADDESYPERFEKQIAFMKSHPEIDILGTGAELIGTDGQIQNRIFLCESNDQIKKNIFKKTLFFHPSVMMKKKVLEDLNGYDENMPRAEDFELWAKGISCGYRYHNLQEILLKYTTDDYKRSFQSIKEEFVSRIRISIRYGLFFRGFGWILLEGVKNILVHYRMYRPRAIKKIKDL